MWSNRSACQTLWNGASFLSLVSRLEREAKAEQDLRKRRCPRWALEAAAVLMYQTGGDKPTVALCRVRDLGRKGIGLRSREPIPRNVVAEVFVFVTGGHYKAKVRVMHCEPSTSGFLAGCEFYDG